MSGASPAFVLWAGSFGTAAQDIGVSGRALGVVAVLAAAVALFLIVFVLLGSPGMDRDLETRLGAYTETQEEQGFFGRGRLLRRFVVRAERMAERRGVLAQIETALEQANLAMRPGEGIAALLGLAVLVALLGLVLTGSPLTALVFAAIAVVGAAYLVASIAARQRRRFEEQLPDTLNLLATSLRAGYSMLQALDAVAEESPSPTSREFQRVLNEIRLGRSVGEALQDSAARMDSVDFDWVVLAFSIQREVGGNLAEVLHTTSETMLARTRLRRELRALTAEGRISAMVLGAMPFVLAILLWVTNPDYLEPLLTSRLGLTALALAGIVLIAGLFWLSRIVKPQI